MKRRRPATRAEQAKLLEARGKMTATWIVGTASAGCDQLTQSAKQAVETEKADVVTATDLLSQAVEQ